MEYASWYRSLPPFLSYSYFSSPLLFCFIPLFLFLTFLSMSLSTLFKIYYSFFFLSPFLSLSLCMYISLFLFSDKSFSSLTNFMPLLIYAGAQPLNFYTDAAVHFPFFCLSFSPTHDIFNFFFSLPTFPHLSLSPVSLPH